MLQLCGDPNLLQEAVGAEGCSQLRLKHLDGRLAMVLEVLGEIHVAMLPAPSCRSIR